MEIKFLKKLENNKTINWDTIKGVSESKIKKVENRFGIKFPLAFKEYLYLAGDSSGGLRLADGNGSLAVLIKDDVRKKLEKLM